MTWLQTSTDKRWVRLVAATLGMIMSVGWPLSLVTPGEEAVKIRNALVLEVGAPSDFNWTPAAVPASFKSNVGPIPEKFQQIARELTSAPGDDRSDFGLALQIAEHLMSSSRRKEGHPIRSNLDDAYAGIVRDGRGYCADFTQVFTAIALAAGAPVRTWSISFESFGAGHAFNEVFDQDREKWVMVDAFHSLYFVDPLSREPLSVVEVHDRLLGFASETPDLEAVPIMSDRFAFSSGALAQDYYRKGMPQLALSWGNNVFDYDASPVVRLASASRYIERLAAIVLGVYPRLVVYPVSTTNRDLRSMFRLRTRFYTAFVAGALGTCLFGWQIAGLILGGSTSSRRAKSA